VERFRRASRTECAGPARPPGFWRIHGPAALTRAAGSETAAGDMYMYLKKEDEEEKVAVVVAAAVEKEAKAEAVTRDR
jgi:hypothetical protein